MMKYQRLRGVKDIFSPDNITWEKIIGAAYSTLKLHNYSLIITPTIEEISLFSRGIGEASDIVMKEMYDFNDKKGRHIVLRPEGTASVVRAFIENSLPEKSDLFYIGQMFRYERPQTGRYREFYQIGVESFGDATPYKDAEVITLASDILGAIGIKDAVLNMNCLAAAEGYYDKLKKFLEENKASLCEDCVNKISRAPIRVLDCKKEGCARATAGAPLITEHLTPEADKNFTTIKSLLADSGIKFTINPHMVRGLDYYTAAVFEFTTDRLGPQQNTVLAGGRYDNLVGELGGKKTPATGFAMGIERLFEVLKAAGTPEASAGLDAFVVVDKALINDGYKLVSQLRALGIKCSMGHEERSFKSQFREAESRNAKFCVIIGENEEKSGKYSVKDMSGGEQKEIEAADIASFIKGRL
jgi:histidyl-tRNA synthetase